MSRRLAPLLIAASLLLALVPAAQARPAAVGLTQLPGARGCVAPGGASGCTAGRAANVRLVAVAPDGTGVVAAGGVAGASQLSAYRVRADGSLVEASGKGGCLRGGTKQGCARWRALETPTAIAFSPDGRSVYVTAENSYAIGVFRRAPSTGAITQLAGKAGCVSRGGNGGQCSTARAMYQPQDVVVSPDGRNVYVAAREGLVVFARDATTGALTQLAGGSGCVGAPGRGCAPGVANGFEAVAISEDGARVVAGASGAVASFGRDPTTGALTPVAGPAGCVAEPAAAAGCGAGVALVRVVDLAIAPDGTTVYAATDRGSLGDQGHGLAILSLDPATGALAQLAGATGCVSGSGSGGSCAKVAGAGQGASVAVSADGASLLLGSRDGRRGRLLRFTRDAATGAVAPRGAVPCVKAGKDCGHARGIAVSTGVAFAPGGTVAYAAGGGIAVLRVS